MFLFTILRLLFLLFYIRELKDIPTTHILFSFISGLPLDISASSYLVFLSLLLMVIGMMIHKNKMLFTLINWFNYILIVFCILISFIGIGLYANWGQKINTKAISFLLYPKEVAGMIFDAYNLVYFTLLLVFASGAIFIYRRFFLPKKEVYLGMAQSLLFFVFFSGCLLLGIRGGFQNIPIDKSWCYYSKHSVLNFASMNDFWNFFDILVNPQIKQNPYIYSDNETALLTVSEMYNTKDSTEFIVKSDRPNIVMVLMESMSADAIACFGGEPGIAPKFDSLAKEGLLFTNYFATGFRTEQGLVALINSFPAQPITTIMRNFGKFDNLPNVIKTLGENGYSTSYFSGGNLLFANTKTYLEVSGIDKMAGIDEVPHSRETDWGAYDEDVYSYQLKELGKLHQPFFSIIVTLTNHEYFDAKVEPIFKVSSEADKYRNTAHYADKCLYDYIQQAKKQPWYSNTLFIVTADHAHKHPLERNYNEVARHHIPMLILGGALKDEYKGKRIEKTASHLDMAATILGQLEMDHSKFTWSKDNLNPYSKGFAYYTFDNGFGFITDSAEVVYDHNLQAPISIKIKVPGANIDKTLQQGKAMLQISFQEYVDR